MNDGESSVQELFDLSGKVAMVTGAAGFLGRPMARALAEAGATVIATSRDLQRARQVAESLQPTQGIAHCGIALDHLDESSIDVAVQQAIEQTGRIDILVNNGHAAIAEDWTTVTHEQFTRQLANVSGYFVLARKVRDLAAEHLTPASIIMLGSMYGLVGSYPEAYAGLCAASPVAYHALKGGIVQMTRHLAAYWAPDQVRVNCLCPGPFPDPSRVPSGLIERLERHVPMGRMGRPPELKGIVLFLASDASSYMTGQALVVDGGWTAW